MAVTLPVLLTIVFGTIETCSMIYLRQTLHIAAYEATRVSLVPKTTAAQVEYAANQILTNRKVKGATITITPSDFSKGAISTQIKVTISATAGNNLAVPSLFFRGKTLTGSCTMMKEY